MADSAHKFHTLDGLRGIAAIAVMEYHFARFFWGPILPHGSLAVDFFFMLSGFVLTFAYQRRLDSGLPLGSFLRIRLVRLYPLYLLGLVLGLLFRIGQDHFGKVHLSISALAVLFTLGALILPVPPEFAAAPPSSFPLNVPSWSLFYEIAINIFHALALRKRGWLFMSTALAVSGILFAGAAERLGTAGFGVDRTETLYGFTRVAFSYLLGIVLFKIWKTGRIRLNVSPLVPAILLLAVFAAPVSKHFPIALDLTFIAIVFPAIILLGSASVPPPAAVRLCNSLGVASYAIYVLHVPLGHAFEQVWDRVTRREIGSDAPWSGLLFAFVTVVAALLADQAYDSRARALLKRWLSPQNGSQ